MFSSAEKTNHHSSPVVQQKTAATSFFRKAGEESFFGTKQTATFFSALIQPKLTVSSPDDPQEKEADAVAEKVMTMPEPATAVENKEEEKLQRQEEKKEEEKIQTKYDAPLIALHRKENDNEVQAKSFPHLHRSAGESEEEMVSDEVNAATNYTISRKNISLYNSDIIQRSGRGPPAGIIQFEQNLYSAQGQGTAMPATTQQFMESRFNADFSGVHIHTGSYAENLSKSINAQAFTHGNDIYFNSGKYSPNTTGGSTLLAHELTHTIQQGASKSNSSIQSSHTSVSPKNIIQRSADPAAPAQLNDAADRAKSAEGKINANKEGADGNREGWQTLVDIFKTTMGEDKVVSGAGAAVQGAVSEADIKKKRIVQGISSINPGPATPGGYQSDAMPGWSGIFVFWALNKSGVPMGKWELGGRNIKPEAAYPPGHIPHAGDIAYRDAHSHFAIVESTNGGTVTSINGNTAGEDNPGGQVQTREHPMSDWTAFFNPLLLMNGSIGSGEGPVEEKSKTLREMRRELFNVNRKEDGEHEEENTDTNEAEVQAKPELSKWSVDNTGRLNTNASPAANTLTDDLQRKEEEKKEDEEKLQSINQSVVQKKTVGEIYCKQNGEQQKTHFPNQPLIQLKQSYQNSSLNTCCDGATAVFSSEQDRGPPVVQKSTGEKIQCGWFDDALSVVSSAVNYVAEGLEAGKRLLLGAARDFAMAIPGYRALRVVLGEDPITGELVERNGHSFIEAAFDIMPGGRLLHQKLSELGALNEAAAWIDTQIETITSLVNNISNSIESFWGRLTLESLAHVTQIFEEVGNIIHNFIQNVIRFAEQAATQLLETVKRFLRTQVVDFIRNHTTAYPLLTVILGQDPVTEQPVERNGTNILNALLELGGEEGRMQRDQMQETGTFRKVTDWIDRGIAVFGNLYQTIRDNFDLIWDVVSIESLMHPIDTFNRIYDTFGEPLTKVWNFVSDTGVIILRFIKEVLLRRLSERAKTVRGYPLVTVIIEKDPFTDELVPATTENLIHGFMSLMESGEEQYQQMAESGAIGRAADQIRAAVAQLNMTPAYIVQLFIDLWNSFSLNDLADPIAAFQRIIDKFGEPIGRLIEFVIEIVKIVVHVILEIMNFPFDLINNIITRAMAAFERIKRDPIGFLKNLVAAIKQGFIQFFDNIQTHLLNGLTGWLLNELRDANVPVPTDFTLRGMIGWVLEILGISMEAIWQKLSEHRRVGPQRVARLRSMINALEGAWTFIRDVQERGMAAIWDKIQEQLSNLVDTVLNAVENWVIERIISRITARLITMLDPTGIMTVINGAMAFYRAIQSFIRYLREMLEVVNSFVNGVADIAEGNINPAANYLENAMDRAMPIVIGFLANQVGLSGVGRAIAGIIGSVRGMVDRALTRLVNRAVDTGLGLLFRVMGRSIESQPAQEGIHNFERSLNFAGEGHRLKIRTEGVVEFMMASDEFIELHGQLTQLRRVYVEPDEHGRGGHLARTNQEEARQQLDNRLRAIVRRKNDILSEAARERNNTNRRDEILENGLNEVKEMIEDMSHYMLDTFNLAFGGATDVTVNDVVFVRGPDMGYKVIRTREIQNGHFGLIAEALDRSDSGFLNYEDHNRAWIKALTNAPPFYLGFTGSSGSGTRIGHNVQQTTPRGQDPTHDPPGYEGIYNRRGHLVAQMFGGPGDRRNIVAMTETANQTDAGMRSIEDDVRAEVRKGTVFNYKVTPDYGSRNYSIDPPIGINVVADEVWPRIISARFTKYVTNS